MGNSCLQNFSFEKIEIGKTLGKGKTDIDVYLENSEKFIWIEIKPINYLLIERSFNKLINQIQNKQLTEIDKLDKEIDKYILILYAFSIDRNKNCEKKFQLVDKNKVMELNDIFKNKNIPFDICYFCLPLVQKDRQEGVITSKTYQQIFSNFKVEKLKNLKNILED